MSAKTKKSTYNPISPAVDQAARLLQCLGGEPGDSMGLTAICKKLHIHNSKGFSILNALSKYDLVTRNNATKTYSLGPALIPLARKAAEKLGISLETKTAGGAADANIFFSRGIAAGVLGTGMTDVHTLNESIALQDMEQTVNLVLEILKIHAEGAAS